MPDTRLASLRRTWEILVLLRNGSRTLAELSEHFGVSQRTIRRDFELLCEVGFPVITSRDDIENPTRYAVWSLAPMPEWPRSEHVPVDSVGMRRARNRAVALGRRRVSA